MVEISYVHDLKDTGDLLRKKREASALTQLELAEKAGISWDTVHRIENGKTSVKLDIFYHICDILNTTPHQCSPSRYQKTDAEADLHDLFDKLSNGNQDYVKRHIKDLMVHLLNTQEADKTEPR